MVPFSSQTLIAGYGGWHAEVEVGADMDMGPFSLVPNLTH